MLRRPLLLLLAAIYAFGLSHIAVLPPFEGFDETAHYSAILQVAETGRLPRLGDAMIAQEVADYIQRGPMPYTPGDPADSVVTYREFFAAADEPRGLAPSPPFAPSELPNWQGQHPPLYYLLMAPLAAATEGFPLRSRLFWLRAGSFTLAFMALCLAVGINGRWLSGGDWATALWPLLLASWFAEFARLGNDSLAALLITLAWWAILAVWRGAGSLAHWFLLGLAFGLGILTKAYVLPIALVCYGFLIGNILYQRQRPGPLLCAVIVTACIGGSWYLWQAFLGVALTNDSALLAKQGGLLSGLVQHWSLCGLLRGLASIVKSFIWSGTWSFARPPEIFYGPYILSLILLGFGSVLWFRHRGGMTLLPWLFVLPLASGLAAHSLMWLALGRASVTGGWYLHVLMAPLSVLMCGSATAFADWRMARRLLVGLAAYAIAFGAGMVWLQIGLFAGCLGPEGAATITYMDWTCALNPSLIYQRLLLLAAPGLGGLAFFAGLALLVAALALRLAQTQRRSFASG